MDRWHGNARPRVLLLAYTCSPERGSEAGVGWNRAVESARHFDTWVICEEHEFAAEIRCHEQVHGPVPGLHFHFVPLRRWERLAGGTQVSWYLVLKLWHRRAYRAACRLHQELRFDLVHQLTFCGFREPGYLWKLDAPFVWGPVGGTQNYPWRFLPHAGLGGAASEALRNVCNWLQVRFSPRVHRAVRKSTVLLAANSTCRRDIGRFHGKTPELLLETGVSRVAAAPHGHAGADDVLRILWSGQLVPRKALHLLIEALARLPAEVRYELRVLGRGPQERRWRRLARRLGVDRHATWLGWLPHQEALQQYAWADLFVFTSLRDTSGNVFLEALAAGLPVVCLDHQGAGDVITAECGVKIAVTRPGEVVDDLAAAILRLARAPAERRQLGQGALELARQYLWSRQGQRMTDLYRRAMAAAGNLATADEEAASDGLSQKGTVPFSSDHASPGARNRDSAQAVRTWGRPAGHAVAGPLFPHHSRLVRTTHLVKRRVAARMALAADGFLPPRRAEGFGVLMYHRIAEKTGGLAAPTWNVPPGDFRRQLAELLARGYQPWPLREVLARHKAGEPIPPRTFVVTFDDGFECLYHEAWPILKELGVPATIFLPTSYLDSDAPLPFDDWSAAGSSRVEAAAWRPLSTAQCAEMLAGGLVQLGTHSHVHADFRGRPELLCRDLLRSLSVLQERFGMTAAPFAFPYGFADDDLVAAARHSGVLCGLSDENELISPGSDPSCWGRLIVEEGDTAAVLAAKLDGWYSLLRRAWLGAWRWTHAGPPSENFCRREKPPVCNGGATSNGKTSPEDAPGQPACEATVP